MKAGAVLGTLAVPAGTLLSAVDEHRPSTQVSPGRFEFHGWFELRVLPASDTPAAGGPAFAMMRNASVILSAQGVDVVLDNPVKAAQ